MNISAKQWRGIIVLILVTILAAVVGMALTNRDEWQKREASSAAYYRTTLKAPGTGDALSQIGEDFLVGENFTSNLPLVVLTLPEKPGTDWAPARIGFYEDGLQETSQVYQVSLCLTNGASKPDYEFRIVGSDGSDLKEPVLGMPAGNSFSLCADHSDKTMLRSYIGLRTASQILDYVPRTTYCEVLIREGAVLKYQGLYHLTEKVEAGAGRVEIQGSTGDSVSQKTGYMVRRGIGMDVDQELDTWAWKTKADSEPLYTVYPKGSDETLVAFMEENLSRIERVVFSADTRYDEVIDTDSFIDYLLVNEYFGNEAAGETDIYYYIKNYGGKLRMGPMSSFAEAMNSTGRQDSAKLVMSDCPIFAALIERNDFISRLSGRYVELRQKELKENNVYALMEEASISLANAFARDRFRWSKGERAALRADEEREVDLNRMKTYLSEHAKAISEYLKERIESDRISSGGRSGNAVFLVIALLLFFVPCLLVNRRS